MLNCHHGAGHLKSQRGHSKKSSLLRCQIRCEGVSSQPPPTGSLGSHSLDLLPQCDCKLHSLSGSWFHPCHVIGEWGLWPGSLLTGEP